MQIGAFQLGEDLYVVVAICSRDEIPQAIAKVKSAAPAKSGEEPQKPRYGRVIEEGGRTLVHCPTHGLRKATPWAGNTRLKCTGRTNGQWCEYTVLPDGDVHEGETYLDALYRHLDDDDDELDLLEKAELIVAKDLKQPVTDVSDALLARWIEKTHSTLAKLASAARRSA